MARKKQYVVSLSAEQRKYLRDLIKKGRASASTLTRGRILLKSDRDWEDERVAEAVEVSRPTVGRVRKRFAEGGLGAALYRKRQERRKARTFDGDAEAHLVAVACSKPPEGRARWSIRLLTDRVVALHVVRQVSRETVRRTLKKTRRSRG